MPSEILPGLVQGESTAVPIHGPPIESHLIAYPPDDLLIEDGIPLESNWHRLQINLLIDMIKWHWRDRDDYFAGGNMFLYYGREQARNRDFRGPDFFLVNNVPAKPERPYWAVWDEEGRYPDLIIELLSPTTREQDLTTKFRLYEQTFATPEYVAYDPETERILAWRNTGKLFEPIPPDEDGRYPLATTGLKIGTWRGRRLDFETTWLRFFDQHGQMILVGDEAEGLRADAADARAEAAEARADALAAELAQLKAEKK